MARSIKPTAWVEPYKDANGKKHYRIRREKGGVRLPDIPAGMNKGYADQACRRELDKMWGKRLKISWADKQEPVALEQLHELYRGQRLRMPKRTQENDEAAFGKLSPFCEGRALFLEDIDTDFMQEFAAHLLATEYKKGKLYSPNSVRLWLRHLRAAFRWALKKKLTTEDPFLGFEMPPAKDTRRYLQHHELKTLFEGLRPVAARALIVFLNTGLRSGELLQLDWSMVSAPARKGQPWILRAKKSKVRQAHVGEDSGYKVQALHPEALAAMGKPQKIGPIFPGLTKSAIQQALRRARERLGLGRIRWHDLRHTWATDLMSKVKDEYALMAVGGWKSRAAVSIYQHPNEVRRNSTLALSYGFSPPALPHNRGRKRGKRSASPT